MNQIPKPLTMRPVSDEEVVIWHQLFQHAGLFSTPEARASAYAALVMTCLIGRISMHDLFNREV